MKLLSVDKEFNVEISAEVLEIPEFKQVVRRVKPFKNDADGRKKICAIKELAYIYHMCRHDGPYSNFEEKERHQRLANDLFEDHTWKPDKEVISAIAKYKELTETISGKTLSSLKAALYTTHHTINALSNEIQRKIDNKEHERIIATKQGPMSGVQLVISDMASLLQISSKCVDAIDAVEKLEEKIKKEESSKSSKIRGGARISERER